MCCRNLLIYFGNGLQHKVMSRFHYSLASDGLLFLGTAESVAGADDMFTVERQSSHIFRKRRLRGQIKQPYTGSRNANITKATPHAPERSADQHLFEALATSLGENSLLVTEDFGIARVYGDMSKYIEIKSSSSLKMHLDLLRSPLREEARSLVTIALRNNMHRAGVRHLLAEDADTETRIDVYPIIAKDISEKAALVVFNSIDIDYARRAVTTPSSEETVDTSAHIRALETEIATTREALQQTIEELETSNEELQSLNEELQSTNEELQATNEELETSNEELQSTNEELITVNEELQVTAAELSGRTGELTSVIESTPLAIIVMDNALQISQATNAAANRFSIRRPIASPHISQCQLPDGYPSLAPLCSEALKVGETVSAEFNSNDTRVLLTCSPYFNVHGQILGVTMVVTEFPGLAREMELLLNNSMLYVTHHGLDGTVMRASESSAKLLGYDRDDILGLNIFDLLPTETANHIKGVERELIRGELSGIQTAYKVDRPDSTPVWLSVDKVAYNHPGDSKPTIYSVGVDITPVVQAKQEAEALLEQIMLLQEMAHVGYWSVDLTAQKLHWSKEVYRIHGVDDSEPVPDLADAIGFYHPDDQADVTAQVEKVINNGGDFLFEKRLIQKDGTQVRIESHGRAVKDESGTVIKLIGVFRLKE